MYIRVQFQVRCHIVDVRSTFIYYLYVFTETQEELEDGFRLLLVRNNLLLNLLKKAGITPPEFIASKIFNYVVAQHQINGNVDVGDGGDANGFESTQTLTKKRKLEDSDGLKTNDKKVVFE